MKKERLELFLQHKNIDQLLYDVILGKSNALFINEDEYPADVFLDIFKTNLNSASEEELEYISIAIEQWKKAFNSVFQLFENRELDKIASNNKLDAVFDNVCRIVELCPRIEFYPYMSKLFHKLYELMFNYLVDVEASISQRICAAFLGYKQHYNDLYRWQFLFDKPEVMAYSFRAILDIQPYVLTIYNIWGLQYYIENLFINMQHVDAWFVSNYMVKIHKSDNVLTNILAEISKSKVYPNLWNEIKASADDDYSKRIVNRVEKELRKPKK